MVSNNIIEFPASNANETEEIKNETQETNKQPVDFSKFPRVRNRKEARALEKVLRRSGMTEKEIESTIAISKLLSKSWDAESQTKMRQFLREGEQVKLNVDKIWNYPDWDLMQEPYKEFIKANEDRIFTVALANEFSERPVIVTLAEDDSEQKWWFSREDLLVYDESDSTFKELWMIEEKLEE